MSMLDTSHFDLNNLPNGFYEDPFKYYSSLRQTEPVKFLPDNSVLISSWQDLNTIYRDTQNFKSDKKISFGEKNKIELLFNLFPREELSNKKGYLEGFISASLRRSKDSFLFKVQTK